MSTQGDKIRFSKYGGIVFANEITADDPTVLLTASKIVATTDTDLLDTVAKQTPSRHVRAKIVIVRDRV